MVAAGPSYVNLSPICEAPADAPKSGLEYT